MKAKYSDQSLTKDGEIMRLENILTANSYMDLFEMDKNPVTEKDIKERYRLLIKIAHPDTGGNTEAFRTVRAYYNESVRRVQNGTFGQILKAEKPKENTSYPTITSKKATYQILGVYSQTDISIIYNATDGHRNVYLKVVKSPSDNDLMMNEITALKHLHSVNSIRNNNESWELYTPTLIEAFNVKNKKGIKQAVHVFENDGNWYMLKDILNDHPYGINPLDAVWMFRRVLMIMGYAHDNKIVHGAITPLNILIYPEQHGLRLTNWENNVEYSDIMGYIKTPTADMAYRDYYPDTVLLGQPTNTYNDLYMAIQLAKTMFKSKDTIVAIHNYIQKYDNLENLKHTNAWEMLSQFDTVIQNAGTPYYPKKWHTFEYPKN